MFHSHLMIMRIESQAGCNVYNATASFAFKRITFYPSRGCAAAQPRKRQAVRPHWQGVPPPPRLSGLQQRREEGHFTPPQSGRGPQDHELALGTRHGHVQPPPVRQQRPDVAVRVAAYQAAGATRAGSGLHSAITGKHAGHSATTGHASETSLLANDHTAPHLSTTTSLSSPCALSTVMLKPSPVTAPPASLPSRARISASILADCAR